MNITELPLEAIVPFERNPRSIGDDSIQSVAASIRLFGFRQPLVLDKDRVIVVGHTRYLAALVLGLATVPCVIAEHLTTEQANAYRIADNRLAELASWDEDLLRSEILKLPMDIDLTELGFSVSELQDLLLPQSDDDAVVDESQADSLAEKWGCELGKTWAIGKHRLRCGSATVKADVDALFGGAVPGLMVTDPPYGVEYDAEWRKKSLGDANYKTGKVANDHIVDWSAAYMLFPGDVAYVWHAGKFTPDVMIHLRNTGLEPRSLAIWKKTSLVISRGNYHWQHEPCVYAARLGADRRWCGGSSSPVWEIANRCPKDEGATDHSTQKPVECMARPMRNHEFELVYDPFAGSGTTIIAAERNGKSAFAMELTPGYCGIILERCHTVLGLQGEVVS